MMETNDHAVIIGGSSGIGLATARWHGEAGFAVWPTRQINARRCRRFSPWPLLGAFQTASDPAPPALRL
jgi:NAD(P)-dependent dehydrogenase (short-subunit alcohol dehydrogenase family)